MSADVSSLFAQGVRGVVPGLLRRQLSYTFGEHGCAWQVQGPSHALRASFHRVLLAASELLQQGFVSFFASGRAHPQGGCALRLHLGGTGPLRGDGSLARMLDELSLTPLVTPPRAGTAASARPALLRASGFCPATQATVQLSCLPAAGFLLRCHYLLGDAEPAPPPTAQAARGSPATLWLVHADRINAASVSRQAHMHGWAVTQMASLDEAEQRLQRGGPLQPRPTLLLVFACDGAPPGALQSLRGQLPASTHLVYAAELGSIWWRDGADGSLPADCELCCHPPAREHWLRWRGSQAATSPRQPGPPSPAPCLAPVLVVDDDEFCRTLAESLLDALGYQARLAHNGEEAVRHCLADPPSLVLMDLDMPQVDGFEATRRLRALQRAGRLPPFCILATSSAPDRSWIADAMAAGTDAFVPKPLRVETLRGELARWCAAAGAPLPLATPAPG